MLKRCSKCVPGKPWNGAVKCGSSDVHCGANVRASQGEPMKRLGGWWRLWIFMCGVYLFCVLALGIPRLPNKRTHLSEQDLAGLSVQAQALVWHPGDPPEVNGWESCPNVIDFDDPNAPAIIPRATPNQIEAFTREYRQIQDSKLRSARVYALLSSVLFWWGVPSIVVLIFGLSVRWVFRGFKKEPPLTI